MRFTAVLLLASVVGCSGDTPTTPNTASLRFTPRVPSSASESTTAEGGPGHITVRATLTGPDPCRTLEAELDQMNQELTLHVSIRPNAVVCVTVLGGFAYDAVIEALRPGRYDLQVVHTYPSTGWPTRTVLSQTLNVR